MIAHFSHVDVQNFQSLVDCCEAMCTVVPHPQDPIGNEEPPYVLHKGMLDEPIHLEMEAPVLEKTPPTTHAYSFMVKISKDDLLEATMGTRIPIVY